MVNPRSIKLRGSFKLIDLANIVIFALVSTSAVSSSGSDLLCSQVFSRRSHVDTLKMFVYDLHNLLEFPEISNDISLQEMKKLKPGHYKLSGAPSPKFLENMVHWGLGSKETANESGLQSIRGTWVLTLARGLATPMAEVLKPVALESLISFDLHTHPVDVNWALMPSFGDFNAIGRTTRRRIYIASPAGISIVSQHAQGIRFNPLERFRAWASDNKKPLHSAEYIENTWRQDFIFFLKQNKMLEFVPWSEGVRIQTILNEGSYDPLQDPHFRHTPGHSETMWAGMPETITVGPLRVLDLPPKNNP